MISIYIHGINLDPSAISLTLGLEPTQAWRRGDGILGQDGSVRGHRKAGMWSLVFKQEDAFERMTELLKSLHARGAKPGKEKGVERAYLDFYFAEDYSAENGTKLAIELEREFVEVTSALYLGIQVTLQVACE